MGSSVGGESSGSVGYGLGCMRGLSFPERWEGMWRFDWAHPESPTVWCPSDHRFCACWEDTGKTPLGPDRKQFWKTFGVMSVPGIGQGSVCSVAWSGCSSPESWVKVRNKPRPAGTYL